MPEDSADRGRQHDGGHETEAATAVHATRAYLQRHGKPVALYSNADRLYGPPSPWLPVKRSARRMEVAERRFGLAITELRSTPALLLRGLPPFQEG